MHEQKMSYQERLNQEKGKMAYRRWRPDRKKSFDYWEEYFHHDAVANIAAQAEAIREALCRFYEDGEMRDDVDENMLSYLINEHLNEHGYIEPKQAFHCNNKGAHFSDSGYKPVCEKQCKECAEWYPANGGYIEPKTDKDGKK